MSRRFDRRLVAVVLLVGALVSLALVLVDSHVRRSALSGRSAAIDEMVTRLPGPDLAVAVGARHLRSPSLEEPAAAFSDAPASADLDPAGGAIAPPRAAWVDEANARASHVAVQGSPP